jgi:hypothetical protein
MYVRSEFYFILIEADFTFSVSNKFFWIKIETKILETWYVPLTVKEWIYLGNVVFF